MEKILFFSLYFCSFPTISNNKICSLISNNSDTNISTDWIHFCVVKSHATCNKNITKRVQFNDDWVSEIMIVVLSQITFLLVRGKKENFSKEKKKNKRKE